jgi:enamine deaminase RidA (YjgF/YER057c/UK114 family)
MTPEENFAQLGLELPPPPKAVGLYQPCLIVGHLCYTSGHVPLKSDGSLYVGCVGREVDPETAALAARQAGLAILATLRRQLGSLNRIKRVVKTLGFVQCTPEFTGQPAVINGCSELFSRVFGDEHGIGARSAVGTNALPMGVSVEIEAIFELHPV